MSLCIDGGWIAANGPCELFTQINIHGLILTECGDLAYIPATCPDAPDEGALDFGPAKVKIGSLGTYPDLLAQRGTASELNAESFVVQLASAPCDISGEGSLVAYQFVAVGPAISGVPDFGGYQSQMRLRGNGDIATYGGNVADNVYGVAKIVRGTGRDGELAYINTCSLLASAANHHWVNLERPSNLVQDLMSISPVAATLYFPAWTYVSDDSLKTDITPLIAPDATAIVKNLVPASFVYTPTGETYYGFTYSNIAEQFPTAAVAMNITTSMSGAGEGTAPVTAPIGGVRTNDLLALLVSSVQDLIGRVETLEAA